MRGINLHVKEGEMAILIGPSGCGKTTLLRLVNQLETMTSGEIILHKENIKQIDKIKVRRQIGYVIQSNGLFPNMTIEKNVMIVPDLLGWDREKQKKRFHYLMELIGMNPDEYRRRYPHELSGGQQQRIGVARALAADPPIMLMDEPFGALDPIIRLRLQEEFLQIQREVRKTVLFVSHDMDEAVKMGDKIVLMRNGEMMQADTPAKILLHPKNHFVEEFVGEDRILKSLKLYTLRDLVKEVNLCSITDINDKPSINLDASLHHVFSMLLHQGYQQLAVVEQDKLLGMVDISVIEQFIRLEQQKLL
nr:ABC transporter ATP-binding protein [Roseburia sp. 1XD42-34]